MGLDRMARNAVGIFCSTNTEKNRCLELPPYYYRDDNCQDIKLKDCQDEDDREATRRQLPLYSTTSQPTGWDSDCTIEYRSTYVTESSFSQS